jgi:hypothetical protein
MTLNTLNTVGFGCFVAGILLIAWNTWARRRWQAGHAFHPILFGSSIFLVTVGLAINIASQLQ